jgi:uncharacterized protein (UPF0548 family)
MFLARRPSHAAIARFVSDANAARLSYGPVGLVKEAGATGRRVDEVTVVIGHEAEDFARARRALMSWSQFDIGWVQVFPAHAPIAPGTNVAVLISHWGAGP